FFRRSAKGGTRLASMLLRGSEVKMTREDMGNYFDRAPLAVCVSDCQIDCGQASADLMKLCFQVHCAFAEMRWQVPESTRTTAATPQTRTGWGVLPIIYPR